MPTYDDWKLACPPEFDENVEDDEDDNVELLIDRLGRSLHRACAIDLVGLREALDIELESRAGDDVS